LIQPGGLEVLAHTTIVLARHGHVERGPADPGLSARGHAEAQALATELAGEPFDAVYCSPMQRAVQTAQPVCKELGLELQLRDGLAEFDRHSNEYVLLSALRAAGDPRFDACMAGDLSSWGLDLASFRAGAIDVLTEILDKHPGGRALVIAHGGVLNVLLGSVLGLDRMWFFHPDNCGFSRVVADTKGHVRLASLNETRHLPAGSVGSR
jgi:probable phosphoglycerate mutase